MYRTSGLGPMVLTFWRAIGGLVLLVAIRAVMRRRAYEDGRPGWRH